VVASHQKELLEDLLKMLDTMTNEDLFPNVELWGNRAFEQKIS
jgi:hypothetical protein